MRFDIPELGIPRVVIIGGGFAGIELAKSLNGFDIQVIMVDKNNFHTFQPLLYQVATSALEADSIVYPIRKIFEGQKNFYFRMAEVKEIVPEENMLLTNISSLHYDYLVIATGSKTNFRQNEGLIISSMPMKTVTEALDLRSLILQNFEKALMTTNERKKQGMINYVIAGGGPTGVELAGAIGELKLHILPKDYPELDLDKMNIYLVQSNNRLLPALSESSSLAAKKYLEKLGVEVVLNTRVLDFHGDYIQTNTDNDIIAKTLIWTAGVEGNPLNGIPEEAIGKGNRIVVDAYNKVIKTSNIFAVGDVALMLTDKTPIGHPMIAPVAIQQGRHLAKNIIKQLKNESMMPFSYFDKGSMATIGKDKAVVEVNGKKFKGFLAWFIWVVIHLMYLIGFRNKIMVLINWLSSYFTYDKGIRLIIRPFKLSTAKRSRKERMEELNSD